MPTPIEILLDPVSLAALGIYATLMLWEALAPARALPQVRGWVARGLASFVVFFYLSSYLPLFWDQYLAEYQLFDLTGLGTIGGALVGLFLYELGAYWWHRSMHRYDALWRVFHQMHHSAERLDTYGAFWFSPADMIGWTALGSLTLVLVVGVTPEAATVFILSTFFLSVFQHANVRTPRWVGYLIQRPEAHSVHHQKNLHYYNFSDFPVYDILFGTFRNPATHADELGFYMGASTRVAEMLAFKDVSKPVRAGASRQTVANDDNRSLPSAG
jgi:sterol desaturase/sphingolipid hydroxylase (fatty acid hydroxylase superfamily)